ncbi:L-threonine dehydratase biosynthetic IlvA (Threonine deaminase) [Durusdinium trenchii]|uniref:threonine ammonia-lyase n=1 Tax=Durusdinium trenchii TaxID=1381693 RepID=A0ABP0LPX5_9DINO
MLVPFAAPRPWQFRSVRSAGRVLQLRRFSEVIEHTAYLNMILNAKASFRTPEEKSMGICACSAGNHAQGVAYSAAALDISAKIFMPQTTPNIKVDSVRRFSNAKSEVILVGDNYDAAYAATMECMKAEGRVLVHPFNDPLVIAGQGTIGKEILEQTTKEDVEAVFCCVGGGGLLAGVGAFLKAVKPSIKVIGVEAIDSAAMTESLKAKQRLLRWHQRFGVIEWVNSRMEQRPLGKMIGRAKTPNKCPVKLSEAPSRDFEKVAKVGDETFRLCTAFADEMITVSTDEICAAIKDSFKDTRVVLEPAGALATAGLKRYAMERQDLVQGRTLVAVSSGANMDFDRLRFVSERADTSETHIAVYIPERPGAFIDFYRFIFPRNVTEFTYRISGNPASIFMSFQAKSDDDRAKALNTLRTAGYDVMDLSENELAKTHGRSLIGGRAPTELTAEEGLFSFEFPEKPGALMKFLEQLPSDFNVSLFHYRGHGADVARVLVGLQVPSKSRPRLREYLAYLVSKGYSWKEETQNEVYTRFLLTQAEVNNSRAQQGPKTPPPLTLTGSSVTEPLA